MMPLTFDDLVENLRESRANFLKHLRGVGDTQWDWKPYPECKSIRETLAHLVTDDLACRAILETGEAPDFAAVEAEGKGRCQGKSVEEVLAALEDTHQALFAALRARHTGTTLETPVPFFAGPVPLGKLLMQLAGEDHYHAGQVAFIRMATDPGWDYYGCVYGA